VTVTPDVAETFCVHKPALSPDAVTGSAWEIGERREVERAAKATDKAHLLFFLMVTY
jgi:hypothetical protein